MIVNAPAVLILGAQRGLQITDAVFQSRVVFSESIRINKFDKSIELPTDKHGFNKRVNQGAIAFRQLGLAALVRLRIVLDVLCFIDHGDRPRVPCLNAFQQGPYLIFLRFGRRRMYDWA